MLCLPLINIKLGKATLIGTVKSLLCKVRQNKFAKKTSKVIKSVKGSLQILSNSKQFRQILYSSLPWVFCMRQSSMFHVSHCFSVEWLLLLMSTHSQMCYHKAKNTDLMKISRSKTQDTLEKERPWFLDPSFLET